MRGFYTVVELTSVAVRAIKVLIKVFAFFCAEFAVNVLFLLKFVFSMGKRALWAEFAFTHLPVATNFCFELLLKVRSGGADFLWLHRLHFTSIVNILFIILVTLAFFHVFCKFTSLFGNVIHDRFKLRVEWILPHAWIVHRFGRTKHWNLVEVLLLRLNICILDVVGELLEAITIVMGIVVVKVIEGIHACHYWWSYLWILCYIVILIWSVQRLF